MHIYINSKLQEIPAQATLHEVVSSTGITALNGVAIAVNNKVIPRTDWATHRLQTDDHITLIRATQGG